MRVVVTTVWIPLVVGVVVTQLLGLATGVLFAVSWLVGLGLGEWTTPWLAHHAFRICCRVMHLPTPARTSRVEARQAVSMMVLTVIANISVEQWVAGGDRWEAARLCAVYTSVVAVGLLVIAIVLAVRRTCRYRRQCRADAARGYPLTGTTREAPPPPTRGR